MRGIVQGVGFRFFTERAARRLGMSGFVRNLPDGTVEVEADGDETSLGALRSELERGPSGARVEQVVEEDLERPVSHASFTIRG